MHWKVSKEKTVGWTDGHHDSLQMSIASSPRAISWAVATLPPWKVSWLILVRDWIREIPFKKPLKPGTYGNLLVLVIAVTEAPSDARWLCDVCRFTWPVGHPAVNDHVHPGFVEVTFPRVAHQSKVTGGKYCSCAQILQLCKYAAKEIQNSQNAQIYGPQNEAFPRLPFLGTKWTPKDRSSLLWALFQLRHPAKAKWAEAPLIPSCGAPKAIAIHRYRSQTQMDRRPTRQAIRKDVAGEPSRRPYPAPLRLKWCGTLGPPQSISAQRL